MIPRRVFLVLVTAGLVLPVMLVVLLAVARLLALMGDAVGACLLDRVGLGLGIVWGIDLVCLLLALGIQQLGLDQHGGSRD